MTTGGVFSDDHENYLVSTRAGRRNIAPKDAGLYSAACGTDVSDDDHDDNNDDHNKIKMFPTQVNPT